MTWEEAKICILRLKFVLKYGMSSARDELNMTITRNAAGITVKESTRVYHDPSSRRLSSAGAYEGTCTIPIVPSRFQMSRMQLGTPSHVSIGLTLICKRNLFAIPTRTRKPVVKS